MSETLPRATRIRRERVRACSYCNKSKAKCTWPAGTRPGERSCERCWRLKHVCELPESGDRRKRGPSTRVAQLEEKIDGLVTLLSAGRELLPQLAMSNLSVSPGVVRVREPSPNTPDLEPPGRAAQPAGAYNVVEVPRRAEFPVTLPTPPTDEIEVFPGFRLSMIEAEDMLQIYKDSYSPLFPFVPVPQTTSAYDLYVEKPFLLRTIMTMTAPQSAATQKEAATWFRTYIAEYVVIKQEKSLELLQAILVCIAWGNYQFYVASEVTNLAQLAIALVIDMELDRLPKTAGVAPGSVLDEAVKGKGGYRRRAHHTREDARALLGCFYISSMVAVLFRCSYHLPHTKYLTTVRAMLESAQEYASDRFLVAQIRLQQLMVKASRAFPCLDSDAAVQAELHAGQHMIIACIRNEVETLKKELPPDITSHYLFSVSYSGALMRLYEAVIYMRPSGDAGDATDAARRTDILWCCLEACQDFFRAYQTIPASDLPYLPLSGTSHLSFAVVTVSRLLFLNDSDWDVQLARKRLDLSSVAERLSELFREADRCAAANECGRKRKFVDEGRSTMMMSSEKVRWIRSWYASKLALAAASKLVPVEGHQPQTTASSGVAGAELPDLEIFDVDMPPNGQFDPNFWEALLNEDLALGALNHE